MKLIQKIVLTTLFISIISIHVSADEMLFPDSSTLCLTMGDIGGHTAEELRIGRNEIYARHGRMFKSEDLQTYFSSCSWYQGKILPDEFDEGLLNETELKNIKNLEIFEEGLKTGEHPVDQSYDFSEIEDAPSKKLIDSYGYWKSPGSLHDGFSNLFVSYNGGDIVDEGAYYRIQMDLSLPATVSSDIRTGDREEVTINSVTGQTKTFVCSYADPEAESWGFSSPKDNRVYYGYLAPDRESINLMCDSDDYVECLVEKDSSIFVRKDAIIVSSYMRKIQQVTEEKLKGWFNEVFFDEKGYITCLGCFGD